MKRFPIIFAAISALLCLLFIAVNGNNVDNQTKEIVAYIILCCVALFFMYMTSRIDDFLSYLICCLLLGVFCGSIIGLALRSFGW